MQYDLVIRNGTVVDGSGRPRFRADVGIVGDRIASIGRVRDRGREEIDAEGHVVAPGFIEIHSHMDAQIFWDYLGTCPAWHGVTTSIMGNCGFTLAPCRESEMDLCLRSLERSEDMRREVLLAGIKWQWETYAEYLDVVEALPKGINYAGYVGHSALRSYVMGAHAFERAASADEVARMSVELESALRAGAIGLSTSRSASHRTSDDKPVASCLASWDELRALVSGVMGRLNTGVFEISPDNWRGPEHRKEQQATLQALAIESGRPTTFIVSSLPAAKGVWQEMLKLIEETNRRGGRMMSQVLSRQVQSVLGFNTQLPFDHLPAWREIRSRPLGEQRSALMNPERRAVLIGQAMEGPYKTVDKGTEMRAPDWETMAVLDAPVGPYRTIAQIAREHGKPPAEVLVDLALDSNFEQFFVQPIANGDFGELLELLRFPFTFIGGSDSGAHVSQVMDASVPTFLLAYWVRKEKAFTLEEAVRRLTFDPALAWGLADRGLVATGSMADLVVFDPETVGPGMPVAATDLPAGGKRLKQKATGMAATVVAGKVLLRHGEHSGAYPGRLLRGPLAGKAAH